MKIAFAWCVFGILSLSGVTISSAASLVGDTEKAIAALEMKWAQAETVNNTALLAPLIADQYLATDSDAKIITRAEFLAEEQATKYSVSEIEDLKVAVFGSTAIARYILKSKGTSKGEAFETQRRWTDTWVKMPNGAWQCVASHGSTIKM